MILRDWLENGKRSTKPHEAALFVRFSVVSWIVLMLIRGNTRNETQTLKAAVLPTHFQLQSNDRVEPEIVFCGPRSLLFPIRVIHVICGWYLPTTPPDRNSYEEKEGHKDQRLYSEDLCVRPIKPGQIKQKAGERQIKDGYRRDET